MQDNASYSGQSPLPVITEAQFWHLEQAGFFRLIESGKYFFQEKSFDNLFRCMSDATRFTNNETARQAMEGMLTTPQARTEILLHLRDRLLKGDPEAEYIVGLFMFYGVINVEKDITGAVNLFIKVAYPRAQGGPLFMHPGATFMLAKDELLQKNPTKKENIEIYLSYAAQHGYTPVHA